MSKVHGKPFTQEQRDQLIVKNLDFIASIIERQKKFEEEVLALTDEINVAEGQRRIALGYKRNLTENVIEHFEKKVLPDHQALVTLLNEGWDGRCCWGETDCHDYVTFDDVVTKMTVPFCDEHQGELAFKKELNLPVYARVSNFIDRHARAAA
jgi:hypothetical protein